MSESPFPFGSSEAAGTDVEEPSADGRRNAVALGALAAVVLGAGAYFFFGGSGDEAETELVQPAAAAAAPAARPAAPKAVGKVPVASKVRLGRSPFEVLYTPPKPPPAVAQVSSSGGSAAAAVTTTASGGGALAPAPVAPATGSGAVAAAPAQGSSTGTAPKPAPKLHALKLLRVYGEGKDRTAVFSIDGKQQTAKVGSTFGPTAELLLLSLQQGPADDQWTAVLQVGDGDPFDVVTGTVTHVP